MAPTASSPSAVHPSSEWFNQRLNMYTLAAGATGVGLLALAPPANAEIVYTPANVTISTTTLHSYALDFNGDGITDVFISAMSRESIDQSGGTSVIVAKAAPGNGVVGYGGRAAALSAGQHISSHRKFKGQVMASIFTFIGTEFSFRGQWANVKNRYLGVQFQIDGETHYGWARLSVGGTRPLSAKLTGYAYETIPNMPITAGKISGTAASMQNPMPSFGSDARAATLGALALGAPALFIWRREDEMEVEPEAENSNA
jgi:hypothetical protein